MSLGSAVLKVMSGERDGQRGNGMYAVDRGRSDRKGQDGGDGAGLGGSRIVMGKSHYEFDPCKYFRGT